MGPSGQVGFASANVGFATMTGAFGHWHWRWNGAIRLGWVCLGQRDGFDCIERYSEQLNELRTTHNLMGCISLVVCTGMSTRQTLSRCARCSTDKSTLPHVNQRWHAQRTPLHDVIPRPLVSMPPRSQPKLRPARPNPSEILCVGAQAQHARGCRCLKPAPLYHASRLSCPHHAV